MSKEHKILSEFFTFLINNQDSFQLQQEDAEGIIQDFCKIKNEQIEKLKEEKRLKGLKRLELIVQKREERENQAKLQVKAQAKDQKQQVITTKKPITERHKIKALREMQALIDRIRN